MKNNDLFTALKTAVSVQNLEVILSYFLNHFGICVFWSLFFLFLFCFMSLALLPSKFELPFKGIFLFLFKACLDVYITYI